MTKALLALAVSVFAAPAFARAFPVGFLEPVSSRVSIEARSLGLEIAPQAPAGAATVPTAVPVKAGGEVAEDRSRLRYLAARAVAGGSAGVYFRLPLTAPDRDLLDYVEEWQAISRAARELLSLQPMLEGGAPAKAPFAVPDGVELRAWTFHGRRYVLLVNPSGGGLPLEEASLEPWRALFAVRSDARQLLTDCGEKRCLPPGGVLWLEGRLWPDLLP